MSKPIQRYFQWTGEGQSHDATITANSLALESCANYTWSVTPVPSGIVGGPPTYTIEVSNDGVTWFEYSPLSTNVAIVDAVDDIHLAFTFMRIVHTANGTTAGTVDYYFTQKPTS